MPTFAMVVGMVIIYGFLCFSSIDFVGFASGIVQEIIRALAVFESVFNIFLYFGHGLRGKGS